MSAEQVTIAILAGHQIESGNRASTSHSNLGPAETTTAAAGTSSWPRRQVAVSVSSEEGEEEMLRRRRPCVVVEDLEALAFGDQAPDVPQHAGDALPSPPPVAAETTSARTSPAAIIISDSPAEIFPSARD
ncbi:hypothetical protein AAC387_Pa05g1199 [Persea americana]